MLPPYPGYGYSNPSTNLHRVGSQKQKVHHQSNTPLDGKGVPPSDSWRNATKSGLKITSVDPHSASSSRTDFKSKVDGAYDDYVKARKGSSVFSKEYWTPLQSSGIKELLKDWDLIKEEKKTDPYLVAKMNFFQVASENSRYGYRIITAIDKAKAIGENGTASPKDHNLFVKVLKKHKESLTPEQQLKIAKSIISEYQTPKKAAQEMTLDTQKIGKKAGNSANNYALTRSEFQSREAQSVLRQQFTIDICQELIESLEVLKHHGQKIDFEVSALKTLLTPISTQKRNQSTWMPHDNSQNISDTNALLNRLNDLLPPQNRG